MLRVRAGDPKAFEHLVGRYQRTVLNTIFKFVGNRATAEDLSQDTFVRVYRARESYEPTAKFETWLYRIVFNVCLNAREHRRRRRTLSLVQDERLTSPGSERSDPSALAPHQQMVQQEIREAVRQAIAGLPEQQRAALIMSRYQDMTHCDIAAALGITEEAVKSLLFRARQNLKAPLRGVLDEGINDEL